MRNRGTVEMNWGTVFFSFLSGAANTRISIDKISQSMQEPPQEVCVIDAMTRRGVTVYSPYNESLKAVVKSCSTIAVMGENSLATETFILLLIRWWEKVSMKQRLLFKSTNVLYLSQGFPLCVCVYTSCSSTSLESSILVPVKW